MNTFFAGKNQCLFSDIEKPIHENGQNLSKMKMKKQFGEFVVTQILRQNKFKTEK